MVIISLFLCIPSTLVISPLLVVISPLLVVVISPLLVVVISPLLVVVISPLFRFSFDSMYCLKSCKRRFNQSFCCFFLVFQVQSVLTKVTIIQILSAL